jgi:cobyric acid synthase
LAENFIGCKIMKIGLAYVKGSVPAFEDFGNIPTHLAKSNGFVDGMKAHKVLDGLIIPGGSIVESDSVTPDLAREIKLMDSQGKFILGICSGFQVLAEKIDIGRRSPCPLEKEGLGILNVSFSPMISNDRVEARISDESFLTKGLLGEIITGFHCHTYGEIEGNASPVFYSQIKRTDYADNPREVLSGVRNDDGNVVGTMVHGCLDDNPALVKNILDYLGAAEKDLLQIKEDNQELVKKIKMEIGIDTGLMIQKSSDILEYSKLAKPSYSKSSYSKSSSYHSDSSKSISSNVPPTLMIASTGSDSGKTFLVTGLAGALRRRGLKVAVLKVGPDIRDIVPALYLLKEKMEYYSSIKIGHLGWLDLENVLESLSTDQYDLVLIEGVMSIFTGILNEKTPYSGAEIAKAGNIPVLLISGCSKGGIETAAVDIAAHADMMLKMGLEVPGLILNRVYDHEIFIKAANYLQGSTGAEMIGEVPKVKISKRGGTPEIEINLGDFCLTAMETVENNLDIDKIISLAKKPYFRGFMSASDIEGLFKSIL